MFLGTHFPRLDDKGRLILPAKFREQLDSRFAHLYHDLEQGTDPHAYIDPYADIPSFRKRDAARLATAVRALR